MQVIQRRAAIAAVMVALILGAWLGAASGALAGPEFPVNTTTAGTHGRPATVTLAGGKFLVLWEGNTSVGVCNIYAQFFTGNGAKHGPEFIVNAVTTEFQDNPAAAVLDDGTIIVAWRGAPGIKGQRLGADGSKMGDEFIVTDTASVPVDPAIAALSNGRFVVVWAAQDADQRGVFGQVMTPAGVKFGRTAFRVNQKQVRAQERPSVAAIRGEPTPPNNGGFIVVWDARDKNLRLDVQGRRFGPNGKVLGDEFAINTVRSGYQYSGKIATLNDGSTVVIWVSNSKIRGQQFTPAGAAVGPEFNVSRSSTGDQDTPKITARADGGFIAVWSASGDGDGTGIFGQRFDANGAKLLPEFLANTGPGSQIFPAIAASPDSDAFVTAWSGVFARVRAK